MGIYVKFYLKPLLDTFTNKMREDRFQIIIKMETDNIHDGESQKTADKHCPMRMVTCFKRL